LEKLLRDVELYLFIDIIYRSCYYVNVKAKKILNKIMKKIIQTTKLILNNILANFTLAKFGAALFTITMVALIKYSISGNLYISYCEF